jgi:O-antigen/teichoic acid export membrane protein
MNWLAFAATTLAGFLMSPFLVHRLGDSVYGVWVLIGSLVGYLGLLDFGITPSTVKYVAEHRARGDIESINRVMTAGLAIYSVMGLASLLISLAIAFSFNDLFRSPLDDRLAAEVVLLAGLNLALTFPASPFVGLVRGYQRYDVDAGITTFNIVARSALLVVLLVRGHGILALSLVTLGFDMLRLIYLIRWAYRLNPRLEFRREYLNRGQVARLFNYSMYVFFCVFGQQSLFYASSVIIGALLSTASVTIYSIASRLVIYLYQLISEMVGVLAPTASHLEAKEDHGGIRDLLILSNKYALLVALPVASVFFALGEDFISLWMGRQYGHSAAVLHLLTAAILIHLLRMPAETVLLGMGRHRITALITFLQAIANIALSLLLVGRFGMIGIALGQLIPAIICTGAALPVYFARHLDLSLKEYLKRSIPSPIAMQAPLLALLFCIRELAQPQSLLIFFLEAGLALVLYGALALSFSTSPAERRALLRFIESYKLKLAGRAVSDANSFQRSHPIQ